MHARLISLSTLAFLLVFSLSSNMASASAIERYKKVDKLFQGGDKSKASELAGMLKLSANINAFKGQALRYLSVWKSDAGVNYCMTGLKGKFDNRELRDACLIYLGNRKAKGAGKVIIKDLKKSPLAVGIALAQMSDSSTQKRIKKYLKRNKGLNAEGKMPYLIALANMGDATSKEQVKRLLEGKKVLSEKDQKKLQKKLDREDKTIARAKKRTGPSAAKQIEAAEKRKASILEKADKQDKGIIRVAAMTFFLLTDQELIAHGKKSFASIMENEKFEGKAPQLHAAIALAQAGDKEAAGFLTTELEDGNHQGKIVRATGNLGYSPESYMSSGSGIIKNSELINAVSAYAAEETNKNDREKAERAVANAKAY